MNYEGRICRPSFETGSFKLPISVGCSYNACKFCCLFKYMHFREITDELIYKEIDRVKEANGKPEICFLGDGNAFHNNTERLIKIISYLKENIPSIKHIRMDATITNIKQKPDEELKKLANLGVDVLYIGIECAIDEMLQFMNKDHKTTAEAREQINKLHNFNIGYAAHIMAGVCGKGRGIENAKLLATFFNETPPVNITNFTMATSDKQTLYKDIVEKRFVVANEIENLEEARELIKNINVKTDIDSFHDFIPFRAKGHLPDDREKLINKIDDIINHLILKDNLKIYLCTNDKNDKYVLDKIGYKYSTIDFPKKDYEFLHNYKDVNKDIDDIKNTKISNNNLSYNNISGTDESIKNYLFDILREKINFAYNEIKNKNMDNKSNADNYIIVCAAKTLTFNGKMIGAAKNRDEAYNMLRALSGKKHEVISAIGVFCKNECYKKLSSSEMFFYNLTDEEIYRYIDNVKPYDKLGAYDMQDPYFDFDENLIGNYTTALGFPFQQFMKILNDLHFTILYETK